VQLPQAPGFVESIRHSNVEPDSVEVNEKFAEVEFVSVGGLLASVIVVSGAAVSTVHE
jgi:hypothetical protein